MFNKSSNHSKINKSSNHSKINKSSNHSKIAYVSFLTEDASFASASQTPSVSIGSAEQAAASSLDSERGFHESSPEDDGAEPLPKASPRIAVSRRKLAVAAAAAVPSKGTADSDSE